MSKWTKHKEKWIDCESCELCTHRLNTVLYRGKLPCDILFVGEAPGFSEDTLGSPFVGKAGHLLDGIIERSIGNQFRIGFSNLVGCIPLDEESKTVSQPPEASIEVCSDRLLEVYDIAKPELVILAGRLSQKHFTPLVQEYSDHECETLGIVHPAAILRSDITQRGLLIQKTEIQIADAVDEHIIPF